MTRELGVEAMLRRGEELKDGPVCGQPGSAGHTCGYMAGHEGTHRSAQNMKQIASEILAETRLRRATKGDGQ